MACDIATAMIVDDVDGMVERHVIRSRTETALNMPLDPEAAREYERDRWGADDEAVSAEMRMPSSIPTFGDDE